MCKSNHSTHYLWVLQLAGQILFSLPTDLLPDIHIGLGHDVLHAQFSKFQRRELYVDFPERVAFLQRGKQNTLYGTVMAQRVDSYYCVIFGCLVKVGISLEVLCVTILGPPPITLHLETGAPSLTSLQAGELVISLNIFLHLHVWSLSFILHS